MIARYFTIESRGKSIFREIYNRQKSIDKVVKPHHAQTQCKWDLRVAGHAIFTLCENVSHAKSMHTCMIKLH